MGLGTGTECNHFCTEYIRNCCLSFCLYLPLILSLFSLSQSANNCLFRLFSLFLSLCLTLTLNLSLSLSMSFSLSPFLSLSLSLSHSHTHTDSLLSLSLSCACLIALTPTKTCTQVEGTLPEAGTRTCTMYVSFCLVLKLFPRMYFHFVSILQLLHTRAYM